MLNHKTVLHTSFKIQMRNPEIYFQECKDICEKHITMGQKNTVSSSHSKHKHKIHKGSSQDTCPWPTYLPTYPWASQLPTHRLSIYLPMGYLPTYLPTYSWVTYLPTYLGSSKAYMGDITQGHLKGYLGAIKKVTYGVLNEL